MHSVLKKVSLVGLLGAGVLLTACGGGGGGGGGGTFSFSDILDYGGSSPTELFNAVPSSPLPAPPSAAVTITQANQNEVADAAESGIDGSVVSNGFSVLDARAANTNSAAAFSAFKLGEETLFKYISAIGAAQNATAKTVMSASGACDYSGSISISVDIANPNGGSVIAGDSLTMSFDNCADVDGGVITDGAMMVTLSSGSLDFNASDFASSVALTMDFNHLSSTNAGLTSVVHGGFTISTDGTNNTLSGTSLYVKDGSGESALMTNFYFEGTASGTGIDEIETVYVSLTLASTTINGLVTIVTDPVDPLVQGVFDNHPSAGTLIITGGASTLTMEILSTTQVRLSLDSNSDGTLDAGYPVDVSWTNIDASGGGVSAGS